MKPPPASRPTAPLAVAHARVCLLRCLALGGVAALVCGTLAAQPAQSEADARIALGRALYHGQQAPALPPRLEGVPIPAMACAQCHGTAGQAQAEAGVQVPAIDRQTLRLPRSGLPGYADAAQLLAAITQGRGRGGAALSPPMPQYRLSATEAEALLAYLQLLGNEAPIGVEDDRIHLGSVLPLSGPQAEVGQQIRRGLQQVFDAANARGGVHGRRLEFVVADSGPQGVARALRTLFDRPGQAPFALVASLLGSPAPDADSLTLVQSHAALVARELSVPARAQPGWNYLLPDLQRQTRSLGALLAQHCDATAEQVLVLHAPALAAALAGEESGWTRRSVLPPVDWDALLREPAARRARVVLALLDARSLQSLRAALAQRAPQTCLGAVAVLGAGPQDGATALRAEAIVLPIAADAQLQNRPGSLWSALAAAAAEDVVEALAQAGRALQPAAFMAALAGTTPVSTFPRALQPSVVLRGVHEKERGHATSQP